MLTAKIVGAVIAGVPAVLLAWALLWRRNRAVFWFALALIGLSLGYLAATGATDDLANRLVPRFVGPQPFRAH